jgi:hypothetical protein
MWEFRSLGLSLARSRVQGRVPRGEIVPGPVITAARQPDSIRTASPPSMTDVLFPGIRSLVQCHARSFAEIPYVLLLTFSGLCQRVHELGCTPRPPLRILGPSQKICNVGQVANLPKTRQIGNLPHVGMLHIYCDGPY